MDQKKLLLNERVEVRLVEEGLRGSWHPGVVIEMSNLSRTVVFDELRSETGKSKLVESVQVTEAIEGLHKRRHVAQNYRGRIRPLPYPSDSDSVSHNKKLEYGLCVDAFYDDAWWEGVILDSDVDADKRAVYFPEEGDELKFSLDDLRVSRVWDEFSGDWVGRGTWVFLELVGTFFQNMYSPDRVKVLWLSLQSNYGFQKMVSEWTCGTRFLWKKYLNEVYGQTRGKSAITESVASKVRNKTCKLKISQRVKREPHPSDTEIQSSNHRGLNSGTSNRNGGESVSGKPGDKTTLVPKDAEVILPVGGVSLMKPRQVRRKCNSQLAEQARGWVIKKPSTAPGSKRNKLFARKKNNKEQTDVKVEPTPDQETDAAETNHVSFSDRCRVSRFESWKKNNKEQTRVKDEPAPDQEADAGETNHVSFSGRHRVSRFESCGINLRLKDMVSRSRKRKKKREHKCCSKSDTICFVCHGGEDLISCKYCFSSYHWSCLGPKVVPSENWFCPSCCCGLCGSRDSISGDHRFSNTCFQCSRKYHIDCLNESRHELSIQSPENFCSNTCYKIYAHLHQLLGTSNPTSVDGLTWTLIRSMQNDCRLCDIIRKPNLVKLSDALRVIQESFEPIIEVHTQRNLVQDIVYSSPSKLKRLDFRGFYVMVLQKSTGEVVSAATIRIHGLKVAEMPLIATDFQFRRQGMCRVLVSALVKLLTEMGVVRLILPAASQLRATWETSFGFLEMPQSDRLKLLGYPLVGFFGTSMIEKLLRVPTKKATKNRGGGTHKRKLKTENYDEEQEGNGIQPRFQHVYKRKLRRDSGMEDRARDYSKILRSFQCVYTRRRILATKN